MKTNQKFKENQAVSEAMVVDDKENNKVTKIEKKPKTQTQLLASQTYQGPIPTAAEFAQYGRVMQDAPERIISVFEKDSDHTRVMQVTALNADISRDKRSQWMVFGVILLSISLTIYSLWLRLEIAAVLGALASLFLVFKGTFSKNR